MLFDREQERRIECGQPENNLRLSAEWLRGRFNGVVRGSRYGEYCASDRNLETLDQVFEPEWVADLELAFRLSRASRSESACSNMFDTYPDPLRIENTSGQQQPRSVRYGIATPFGINGRFVYGRVTYRF